MSGRQSYLDEQHAICGPNLLFSTVIAQHANALVEMVHHDRGGSKRKLLDTWKRLGTLNNHWVKLLSDGDDKFHHVCSRLVNGYTECIGDFILEGACHKDRVQALTRTEANFYSALGNSLLQNHWQWYSDTLMDYVEAVDRYGLQSDEMWSYAARVLVAGRLLGHCMDCSIKRTF